MAEILITSALAEVVNYAGEYKKCSIYFYATTGRVSYWLAILSFAGFIHEWPDSRILGVVE